MGTYIMLSTLTDEGAKTIKKIQVALRR